jgi:hypothetical protein
MLQSEGTAKTAAMQGLIAQQTIVIDFDQDAAGNDISDATLIGDQYTAVGVHFTPPAFYTGRRTSRFPTYSTNSSLNMLCTNVGATTPNINCAALVPVGGQNARLVAALDTPAEFASIIGYTRNDGPFDSDGLMIDAYDAAGNFLARGEAFCNNNPPPHNVEGVCVASVSTSGIRRLVVNPRDTDALDTLTLRFETATDTPTPTPTNTPTATATNTPTATPTDTPTATATNTPTPTPTDTPTATATNTPTATPTATATNTPTPTPTDTPTATATNTPTPTPIPPCDLYPIAVHKETLDGVAVGDIVPDIYNGAQPGNFGWLTWAGAPNVGDLANSLTPPGDSDSYVNPEDPNDHRVSVGDWLQGSPGVGNSKQVRLALDALKRLDEIIVPVWDAVEGSGNNALYRVVAFARVRLIDYNLPGENRISAQFLGFATCPD